MTSAFILQFSRFKDLIAQVGPERLFAAPLVTPEDAWFPDRWSPDLECVRRILLRLAEYAGLPDLDVEVVTFPEEAAETRMPELAEWRAKTGATGMFEGIHEGCAWFGIEESQLAMPQSMVGWLAHEMAHTWRHVHDIHVAPHRWEEECTDVTAIFLGFGILLSNAAYGYLPERQGGVFARANWSVKGYIDVEDMAGLLACWAKLKGLSEESILKHLGPTQVDGFRKAWAHWSVDDLREQLGIPAGSMPEVEVLEGASQREFKPSRAARSVHESVERLVAAIGEDGGLAAEPTPFPTPVPALPHRKLATWGRISAAETWARTLALVSDPEWDTQAIVLDAQTGGDFGRHVLGHVRDRDARDARHLGDLLARAFRSGSPFRSLLVPQLPTFVSVAEGAGNFGLHHLESIFRMIADEADPAQVVREADWLELYRSRTLRRLDFEREHGGMPHPPSTGPAGSKRWWAVVSDLPHVRDERLSWYGAASRRPAQTGPTNAGASS